MFDRYAVMTMHQGRSDMSAGNEDKNPSPVESQFHDLKDKQQN